MPIPTRSQSASRKNETGIPTRQQSLRQGQSTTNTSEGSIASRTRSAVANSTSSESTSRIAAPRSIPRPVSTQINPASAQTPQVIPAVGANRIARSASTRVPANAPTAEARKPGHARHLSSAIEKKPLTTGTHVRAASTVITFPPTTASSRTLPTLRSGHPGKKQAHLTSANTGGKDIQGTVAAEDDLAAATDSLRDELFQLMILHQSSTDSLQSFTNRIEREKDKQYKLIHSQQDKVLTSERTWSQAVSFEALQLWLSKKDDIPNDRQLQILGKAIADLEKLLFGSQRLQLLIEFEDWLSNTMAVREYRTSRHDEGGHKLVSSIGADWHAQMRHLQDQLTTLVTTLEDLGNAQERSGISLTTCRHLQYARVVLDEAETAMSLEQSLMQAETEWEALEIQKVLKEQSIAAKIEITRAGIWTSR